MAFKPIRILNLIFIVIFIMTIPGIAAQAEKKSEIMEKPAIGLAGDMGETIMKEAVKVKEDFKQQAQSLFERRPLGWNLDTIHYLYKGLLSLPLKIPTVTKYILKQSRVLGAAGSLLVLLFIGAILYSLLGQKWVFQWVEKTIRPFGKYIPEAYYAYFQSGLKALISALIPLFLLCLFAFINAMITYRVAWFQLTGRLLILWATGAIILNILKESLTRDLFAVAAKHGRTLFRWARLVLLYVLLGMAILWTVEAFEIRPDALAFIKLAVYVSIIVVLFQLFLRKEAFLSLFPRLSLRGYQEYIKILYTLYYPLLIASLIAALLWCLGYDALGRLVLKKIWFTTTAFLVILLLYYILNGWLKRWSGRLDTSNEAALFLARSLKPVLLYATVIASISVGLNLLGLLSPLQRIMSFGIFQLGGIQISLWIILKAVLILLGFVFASRLVEAFMDYRVYPALGIDPGFGYALNTLIKYVSLIIGFLISLNIVGLNLRFLLVFAGAIGIGVGLGLQNLAGNVLSGFTIIFGGKIRKGDWIEVGETLGTVTDIYLRATKVRTRDNVEYLIPNSELISKTIVNYSLSSPMIRINLPVGVSYKADPHEVEKILLEVAEREPLVSKFKKPIVRFMAYAESSINFDLLIWIDVRYVPRREVRSTLYFAIFDAFKKAGIEIPFPQRDIHVKPPIEHSQRPDATT